MIQENINNSQNAAPLITQQPVNPYNMAKLLETLKWRDAFKNVTKVVVFAIEHGSPITNDHLASLIHTLGYLDASNNSTTVLLKAIECNVIFTSKERRLLALNEQKRWRKKERRKSPQSTI